MSYRRRYQIEFNHCDPAGIVFYPRYFELINSVIENFFAEIIGHSFAQMHLGGGKNGVPTVKIETEFLAPSRLGETVEFALVVEKLGGASMVVRITAMRQAEVRVRARITLVWVDDLRPSPWPEPLRQRVTAFMESAI